MFGIRIVEIFSLIKRNLVAFISICFFVILAVGLFLGMGNASDATVSSIYGYYEAQHLHDLEVILPYGITDEELKQLEALDGIDVVEKAPYSYEWFTKENDRYQAKVSAVPKNVDVLSLREGKLPEKSGEVAIEQTWAKDHGISIGDTISFRDNYTGETEALTKIANYDEKTVEDLGAYFDTGKDSRPLEYLTVSEYRVTAFIESPTRTVTNSNKADAVTNELPIDVQLFVTEDCFRKDQFAYCNQVTIFSDDLRGYTYRDETYKQKSSELKSKLQDCLDSIYADKNRLLRENKSRIEKRWQKEIDDGEKEIDEAEELIAEMDAAIKAGFQDSALKTKLADAQDEIEESKKQLSEAKENLEEFAKEELEELDATVLDREYNVNYFIPSSSIDMLENMRVILSGTFILIGLMVCFSAISRFVTQQTKLIGTKKALGMRIGEILATFMWFTGISVVLGCLIGTFLVGPIIQKTILSTMGDTFNIDGFSAVFDVREALVLSLFELVTLLAVTWLTVRKKLKRTAISLLAGNEIKNQEHHFYEKLWVWKRLSLFAKTIINNATTDFVRVFATIIGIAGATALLVISITIYDNLGDSLKAQFTESFHFDSVIYVENSEEDTLNAIKDVLEKHQAEGIAVYWKNTLIEVQNGELVALRFVVPENQDEFDSFVEIRDGKSRNRLDTGDGLYCSYSMYNWYKADAERILINDRYGKEYEAEVDAFFSSYLITGFLIADKATYAGIFGDESKPNAFLVKTRDVKDLDALKSELNKVEGYSSMTDYYLESSYAFKVVEGLVIILVAIYLCVSFIMSVMIVLNLLNQHIQEKKKELIVLRINGYGIKDAKRYIYTDTIIFGVISVLLGAVIGSVLGNIAMSALDTTGSYYLRQVDYFACVAGIAVSGILTIVMSVISLREINRLKLSDISM